MRTDGLAWLLKIGLGAVLIYAAVLKISNPAAFAEEISNYQLLPAWSGFIAAVLPPTELLVGALLIVARPRRAWLAPASLAAASMMLVFTVAVTQAVLRGIDTACGCFGADSGPVSWWVVFRVVALGLVAGWIAWRYRPTEDQSKLASTIASVVS